MRKTVAVFAGSSGSYRHAFAIGAALGVRARIKCGGASVGVMREFIDGAMTTGGHVTGIVPAYVAALGKAHPGADRYVTRSLQTATEMMVEGTDAFVALPGGIGTVNEVVEVLCLRHYGRTDAPLVLADTGFWFPMFGFLDRVFGGDRLENLVRYADTPEDVVRECGLAMREG